MSKKYKRSLFIFRRDLRLTDNTGLIEALKASEQVITCFIFDPRQLTNNPYRSDNAIEFMLHSLDDLEEQIRRKGGKLHRFYENPETCIVKLIKELSIQALYFNKDYTPFSESRDKKITNLCTEEGIACYSFHDALLNPPELIVKADGTPYVVFTPFYKQASKIHVNEPQKNNLENIFSEKIAQTINKIPTTLQWEPSKQYTMRGGRAHGKKILQSLEYQKAYLKTRDIPALPTTRLSAHLKFGTVSVRETFHAIVKSLGNNHPLLRQLYWRDFYTMIAWWFPNVFGSAFRQQYNTIPWSRSKKNFERWCTGTTGFPIVDAGMRELNETGFMHNRVRMITGSFLIKDLGIDWRWGEQYFATKLVDYDPAVNNGNWQWVASTGCDAQPYFRIFNPWLQQKKFDPDCSYIKKWIPELRSVPSKLIHNAFKDPIKGYHAPMLDHKDASQNVKQWFSEAK